MEPTVETTPTESTPVEPTPVDTAPETVQESTPEPEATQEQTPETEQAEENPETPAEPQKIKLGDKEYTTDELQELIESKPEPETDTPKLRPTQQVQQDLQTVTTQCQNDFQSFAKRFIQKSMVDPSSGYTPEQLFQHGQQTGDFSHFINTLQPVDAIAFERERQQNAYKYDQAFGQLNKELQDSQLNERKTADMQKYTDYKTKNDNFKDSPFLSHIFDNYISQNYQFDEKELGVFLDAVQKAREFEAEQLKNQAQTEDGKNRMMNSPINNGGQPVNAQNHIFTREEISKMSTNEYLKNEKVIFEQLGKDLIK